MIRRLAIALVGLVLLSSRVMAQGVWPNEPPGSTTLIDCDFSHPTCNARIADPYNSAGTLSFPPSAGTLTVQSAANAPLSPTSVLRSSLVYPNKTGGTELHYYAPRDIRNVYVGLWWRPSNPFGGNVVGWNKTFFIKSGYANSNGVFLWGQRFGDTLASNGDLGVLMWNTQIIGTNTDRCGPEGLQCRPNMGNLVRMMPGLGWYRIEAHLIASSCASCYDGRVRWWITPPGGVPQLQGDYPNFLYSTSLKEWVWAETWDGFGNGTVPSGYTSNQYHEIDHLHISSTDCSAGCTSGGTGGGGVAPPPPPPLPPNKPTNLRVQ